MRECKSGWMMRQVSKCAQPGERVERPYRESGAKSEGMNVGLEPGTFPHVYMNQFHLTWCGATYSCVGPYCRIFVRPSTQYPASIRAAPRQVSSILILQ